ncbi:Hypothetical predicted protein [Olea europaea subsp. europaea]|uniref:Uncharacterized protein n=1 Tax=Olea europaea subsp. europaea TaxID=158383 RepID=A0A8S0U375_OLEEU|nr:Hypothetical predicted protein [Olea europaea subsp. europaea]
MDPFELEKGSNALNTVPKPDLPGTGVNKNMWKQMGNEEKKTAVNEEMIRLNRLPANSSYASHRLRVLDKMLQLLSIQVCVYFCSAKIFVLSAIEILVLTRFKGAGWKDLFHMEILGIENLLVSEIIISPVLPHYLDL